MAQADEGSGSESGGDTAAAVAVALGRKGRSSAVDEAAAAFLRDQRRLLSLQIENLEEDRALQHRHLALRYFGDRLRIGLQLLAILLGLFVVVGLGAMVWQAHEDHGLVVDAFSVPPDLAQQGLTGQVVAARLLDKLNGMQSATISDRAADTYQNNWGSDIKVEIPNTGLTFSEFERLLTEKLGHVSHLTGEVFHTPTGIAVTARLGNAPPQTFQGTEANLDTLLGQGAEAVYRASQPYRYAQFLFGNGRPAEGFVVISNLATSGPQSERGYAYALWGGMDLGVSGDTSAARKHLVESLNYSDTGMMAGDALVNLALWSGHDQDVTKYATLALREEQTSSKKYTVETRLNVRLAMPGYLAHEFGDYLSAAKDFSGAARTPGWAFVSARADLAAAGTDLALAHDPAGATAVVGALEPNGDISLLPSIAYYAANALPWYAIAAARGDWTGALADARDCDAWLDAQKKTLPLYSLVQAAWVRPLEALAMARTGDAAGAEGLISTTALDCYLCLRVRGQIAAAKHDWPGAERWFAEAVRQDPELPAAYSEWGDMRLARGDAASAIAEYQLAHQKGPRFGDPLKGWGDALAAQGRWKEAVAKYDEAAPFAPAWQALRQARILAASLAS